MTRKPSDDALDRALDAALSHALAAPDLPPGFRARLQRALARATADDAAGTALARLRQRLESEQHERLSELQAGYLRLRRRSLAALVVGAFAAGASATFAMPWLVSHIGPSAPLVMSGIGALLGLTIAFGSWLVRPGVPLHD